MYFDHPITAICDEHCAVGCLINGPGTCDGECDFGYGYNETSLGCDRKLHCLSSCIWHSIREPVFAIMLMINSRCCFCTVCDVHCVNGCLANGAGNCDGECETNYTYNENTTKCDGTFTSLQTVIVITTITRLEHSVGLWEVARNDKTVMILCLTFQQFAMNTVQSDVKTMAHTRAMEPANSVTDTTRPVSDAIVSHRLFLIIIRLYFLP